MERIVMLFPFDLGCSYLLPPNFSWENAIVQANKSTGDWSPDCGFPEVIRQPLGLPILYTVDVNILSLNQYFLNIPHCKEVLSGYIYFFPIGFGMVVVNINILADKDSFLQSFQEWEPNAYQKPIQLLAKQASAEYHQMLKVCQIHEIEEANRSGRQFKYYWIYPLFFNEEEGSVIEWRFASIAKTESASNQKIIAVFIVASLIWQTLQITDSLLDEYLYDISYKLEVGGSYKLGNIRSLQASRAFCARILDNCHTLRWTIDEECLRLLDAIHSAWSTNIWKKTISEKIDLLTNLYDQTEANFNQQRDASLNIAALLIAIISTINVGKDLLDFILPSLASSLLLWQRIIIALAFPLGGYLIALIFLKRRK